MEYLLFTVVVALVTMSAMRIWLARKARQMQGAPLPKVDEPVAASLRLRGKALLYFFSPHCGPCKAMTPEIESLSHHFDNVFLIDVSQDVTLARSLGVMVTPTVLLITPQVVESVLLGRSSVTKLSQLLA